MLNILNILQHAHQNRMDQIVLRCVDIVPVTSHVIEQLGSVTQDVNLDILENCVTQVL